MTTYTATVYENTPGGVLSICCLGKTGVGKSTLLNRLVGDTSLRGNSIEGGFEAKRCTESVTKDIIPKTARFSFTDRELQEFNTQKYKLIDTPGLNDSEGGDKVLVDRVVDFFKETCDGINIFLILLKVTDCRYDSNTKGILSILSQLFGKGFWKHVMIVFTRYDIGEDNKCEDEDEYKASMEDLTKAIAKDFKLGSTLPCTCFGKRNYVNGIKKIILTGVSNGLFKCEYMKGWDQLKLNKDKNEEKKINQLLQKILDLENQVNLQLQPQVIYRDRYINNNNSDNQGGFRVFKAVGKALDTPLIFNWVEETVSENCAIM